MITPFFCLCLSKFLIGLRAHWSHTKWHRLKVRVRHFLHTPNTLALIQIHFSHVYASQIFFASATHTIHMNTMWQILIYSVVVHSLPITKNVPNETEEVMFLFFKLSTKSLINLSHGESSLWSFFSFVYVCDYFPCHLKRKDRQICFHSGSLCSTTFNIFATMYVFMRFHEREKERKRNHCCLSCMNLENEMNFGMHMGPTS